MNDEQYVKKVSNLKLCELCAPLNEECNNLIDLVSQLEQRLKETESKLRKSLPHLRDYYDGYYGERPVTKLAVEIEEFLNNNKINRMVDSEIKKDRTRINPWFNKRKESGSF